MATIGTLRQGVVSQQWSFNPLPNYKILDMTKLQTFADDKLNIAKMTSSKLDRVENTMGKGEMLVTSIFSFSQSFSKTSSLGSLKVGIV